MTGEQNMDWGEVLAPIDPARQREHDQYMTPLFAAELCLKVHQEKYGAFSAGDLVLEPTCGLGSFLRALPDDVPSIGVEKDRVLARKARTLTGRRIISGDILNLELGFKPTSIIGNPPFEAAFVDALLDRCLNWLDDGSIAAFIIPAYMFQTAKTVARYNEFWTIDQQMIPRNIYHNLRLPLLWATFIKERNPRLVNLAFYRETADVHNMRPEMRAILERGAREPWKQLVVNALRDLGGKSDLQSIYAYVMRNRSELSQFWKQKIRQTLQRSCDLFTPLGDGIWALVGHPSETEAA